MTGDHIRVVHAAESPARLQDWRWYTSDGFALRPCVMRTSHLHNTLVMIWHHTMPESARVRPYYRAYSFGPRYDKAYMLQAIKIMSEELASRDDLTERQRTELAKMVHYIRFGDNGAKLIEGGRA